MTTLNKAEQETIRSIRTAESQKDEAAIKTAKKDWRDASRNVSKYLSGLEGKYGASCVKCEEQRVSGQVGLINDLG